MVIFMKNKVVLIGLGNVGNCFVFSLLHKNIKINEIVVIDINEKNTKGEILDFQHCLPFLNSSVKITYGDYSDCKDADLVVITAGARQEVGETRLDLIHKNAKLFKTIISQVVESGFQGIFLNATNPLDVMTQLILKYSGFPANKVIGSGTALDTARLKYNLQDRFNTDYDNIEGYVLGEHGDSSFITWSNVLVDNIKVINTLSLDEKEYIENRVHNAGYELLNSKGYSSSAIGVCLADITCAILNDEKLIMCTSNYDEKCDAYYGFPTKIGRNGVEERVALNLSTEEIDSLTNSVSIIKEALEKVL